MTGVMVKFELYGVDSPVPPGGMNIVDAVNDINGPVGLAVAKELQAVAEARVVPESVAALSEVHAEFTIDPDTGFKRFARNDSDIPRYREGNLARSITANPTTVDEFGLVSWVSADESKMPRGGYARALLYGEIGRGRGGGGAEKKQWKFLPERDYYIYGVEQGPA